MIKADGSTELRKFKAGTAGDADAIAQSARQNRRPRFEGRQATHQAKRTICWPTSIRIVVPGAHLPGANVEARARNFRRRRESTRDDVPKADNNEKLAKGLELLLPSAVWRRCSPAVNTRLAEFAARLKKLEDQPLPLGTSSVRVAEKSEDLDFAAARIFARPAGRARGARRRRHPQTAV